MVKSFEANERKEKENQARGKPGVDSRMKLEAENLIVAFSTFINFKSLDDPARSLLEERNKESV